MTRMAMISGQTRGPVCVTTLSFVMLMSPGMGQAQTTNITSSGLNTKVSAPTTLPNGTINHDITGGTRPGNGANLFHSFGEFSVGTNHIANFLNDTALPTSNIFGRINGGQVSNIWGTIQTTGFGSANLYLINPSGFVFGPTATLNVGGSFAASTADYLKMTDGAMFFANPSQSTVLSVAPVKAFGFLGGTSSQAIVVQPSSTGLEVPTNQSLSLIGGDITLGRSLSAPGGQINVASVASAGEVILASPQAPILTGFSSLGNISISDSSIFTLGGTIFLRGGRLLMDHSTINTQPFSGKGGDIDIGVQALTITNSTLKSTQFSLDQPGNISLKATDAINIGDSFISSATTGAADGGQISIAAPSVNVTGHTIITSQTSFSDFSGQGGRGGDIVINADTLALNSNITPDHTNQLAIDASASGCCFPAHSGNGGSIKLSATQSILVNGASLSTRTEGDGSAGNISVSAPLITLDNIAILSSETSGTAKAGNVSLNGGIINILHGSILTNSSVLSSNPFTVSTDSPLATGGNIDISATNSVLISGFGASGSFLSPNKISSTTSSLATGGRVSISTPSLMLDDGAQVTTATSSLEGGIGGAVLLNVGRLSLQGGATISSGTDSFIASNISDIGRGSIFLSGPDPGTFIGGQGGSVTIVATNGIVLSGSNTGIFSRSLNNFPRSVNGAGGQINLRAGLVNISDGASISASTSGGGNAGNITVNAGQVLLSNGAVITSSTSSAPNAGVGGTINISSQSISMSEGAKIDASTSGPGNAGKITISSGLITGDKNAFISTSSTGSGSAGDLSLNSPTSLTIRGMTVQTSSSQTSGGNIKLTAPNLVRIVDSTITSSVQGQAGSNGGNINIDPQLVVIQNSQLLANANAGAGGNITIAASGAVLVDPNSLLSATAGPAGVSGSVNISAPIQILSGALVPLKLVYNQAGLSGDRCAADPKGQFSSFVQTGRDGVPQVPGALSPSPLSFLDFLTSGSLGPRLPNLTAARLGLDSVSLYDSTLFRFHSACRS